MPKDVAGTIREFKAGKLHSGSKKGPVVKDPKQALAVAMKYKRQMQGSGRKR